MQGTSKFADDWLYLEFAQQIISQGILVLDISNMSSSVSSLGPIFPLIVSFSLKLFGDNYYPIIILNAMLSAVVTVLIFVLGNEIFNKYVAFFGSIWSLFYIYYLRWIPFVLKEVWLQFLFLLIIILLIQEIKRKNVSWKMILLFSLIFSILIHSDERFFVYSVVFAFLFVLFNIKNFKCCIKKAFLFLSFVLLFMIPWLVRNNYVYDRPVFLTERTAILTDKILGYNNNKNLTGIMDIDQSSVDSVYAGQKISDADMNSYIDSYKYMGIKPHKYTFWEKYYTDFKEFFRPFRFNDMFVSEGFRGEGKWSLSHNIIVILSYGILLPFFVFGIIIVFKKKNIYGILLLFIIFIHLSIHQFIILSQYRYRVPLDAFIILISFYGIYYIFKFDRIHKSIENKTE